MSTEYTGNPSNVTTPLARVVIDATNATPIVLQTSVSHGYQTGDYVEVASVGGNLAANGGWKITIVDADHFSLDGSIGSAAYTAGGTVTDESLTPTITQPADGDLRSAASVNLAIDTLADRSQWLARRSRPQKATFTAAGTFVVPASCYWIDVEMVGGGAGGGGGAGSGGVSNGNAAGGGGALMARGRFRVTPGETLTFAPGAGGAGGAGGAIGAIGGFGAHGLHSTLTGSVSGLLLTAYGAQGAVPAAYAAAGWTFGGLPYRWHSVWDAGTVGYAFRGVTPAPGSVAFGSYPHAPIAGQGGMGGDNKSADYTHAGGNGPNRGGGGGTVAGDYTGGGGSSEWIGGVGGGAVTSNAFNKGVAGNAGTGPGAGGSGGGGGFAAHAGGAGGAGIGGACAIKYNGTKAVTT